MIATLALWHPAASAFSPAAMQPLPSIIQRLPLPSLVSRNALWSARASGTIAGSALTGEAERSASQKKRHTLLTFGYTGTGWYGLQSHSADGDPNMPTVSDAIRKALLSEGFIAPSNFVTLERTKWTLASRTDKGDLDANHR